MPIYHYKCKDCEHEFEHLVGVTSDSKELKCSKCESLDVEKTLGSFSVRLAESKRTKNIGQSCSTGCCPSGR